MSAGGRAGQNGGMRARHLRPVLPAVLGLLLSSAALAQDSLAPCLARLTDDARTAGVGAAAFERFTRDLQADPGVLALLDDQPEFKTPIWDYLAALVDEQRVADGRARLAQWAQTLAEVDKRFGVDPATVVAVWGVESDYGQSFGKRELVRSLGTLACLGRRQAYFKGEFFSLLKLLERGDVRPEQAVGSWAGAFGHTQFMPSTYQRLAVDFDGDGRRDLVASIPDALASTANFLARAGWKSGQDWGHEVLLPPGFDAGLAGRRNKRPVSEWQALGLRRPGGAALAGSGMAGLLLPAGAKGPAFLVTGNFDAIYGYNAAESYALAIAHLADRLRGGAAFHTPWPTDDPGLSRADRKELQRLLAARGHAIGEIDGMLGSATRSAIRAEQQRLGWPEDGRAGQKLLKALRGG
jgi:lytic murein transglycosylase